MKYSKWKVILHLRIPDLSQQSNLKHIIFNDCFTIGHFFQLVGFPYWPAVLCHGVYFFFQPAIATSILQPFVQTSTYLTPLTLMVATHTEQGRIHSPRDLHPLLRKNLPVMEFISVFLTLTQKQLFPWTHLPMNTPRHSQDFQWFKSQKPHLNSVPFFCISVPSSPVTSHLHSCSIGFVCIKMYRKYTSNPGPRGSIPFRIATLYTSLNHTNKCAHKN